MNTIGYFEIQSADPGKAVEFYKSVFDWNFVRDGNLPIEYYRMINNDGIFGAILKRSAPLLPLGFGTNAFTCSVRVDNFDAISEKILNHGGKVALPKFAVPGKCWQGYFVDVDNNVFGLFQADEMAR